MTMINSLNVEPSFENYKHIENLNKILKNPLNYKLTDFFCSDGFIRLNMIYLSPFCLPLIKAKFDDMGLVDWSFLIKGMKLNFKTGQIIFDGYTHITKRDKIFSVEIDFDPIVTGNGFDILNSIEE
ncbi:hypothetical protein DMUE_2422 [Dictyocoela muelleri]|nr:hypothetical protein DMUE_2422 [Dictyocoela muelleri]